MVLEILTYPNKKLFEKALAVSEFDENLGEFIDNLHETMEKSGGIGLAATQVGVKKRVFVINLLDENGEQKRENALEIINPKFLKKSGEIIYQEGCLSVPGFYEEVKRFGEVILAYQDRHGNPHEIAADGLLAVALQHENDHLDGHLFIEKIGYNKRKKFDKEFRQAQKNCQKPQNKTRPQNSTKTLAIK